MHSECQGRPEDSQAGFDGLLVAPIVLGAKTELMLADRPTGKINSHIQFYDRVGLEHHAIRCHVHAPLFAQRAASEWDRAQIADWNAYAGHAAGEVCAQAHRDWQFQGQRRPRYFDRTTVCQDGERHLKCKRTVAIGADTTLVRTRWKIACGNGAVNEPALTAGDGGSILV
jgi:hypothetical protein